MKHTGTTTFKEAAVGMFLLCALIAFGTGCARPQSSITPTTITTPASIADNAQRVEIPISQTVFAGGEVRYSIPMTIGGKTFDAMLDTGSTGLRILPAAQNFAYVDTNIPSTYGYGSGVQLSGAIGKATVTLGGIASVAPIPIEIVQSIKCVQNKPHCPASHVSQSDYRIGSGGVNHTGFEAIVGVNLRQADAINPLTQIANGTWIIELPQPGQATPGKLILNPSPDELTAYTLFDLARSPAGGWVDRLPGCIFNDTTDNSVCQNTIIDTGAVGFRAISDQYPVHTQWKNGELAHLAFKNASGESVEFSFTVGTGMTAVLINPPVTKTKDFNTGMYPLLNLSALYDFAHGKIGLKKRE